MIVSLCILKDAQMNNLKRHTVSRVTLRGDQAGSGRSLYPAVHKENGETGSRKGSMWSGSGSSHTSSHCPPSSAGPRSNRSSAPSLIFHVTTVSSSHLWHSFLSHLMTIMLTWPWDHLMELSRESSSPGLRSLPHSCLKSQKPSDNRKPKFRPRPSALVHLLSSERLLLICAFAVFKVPPSLYFLFSSVPRPAVIDEGRGWMDGWMDG